MGSGEEEPVPGSGKQRGKNYARLIHKKERLNAGNRSALN